MVLSDLRKVVGNNIRKRRKEKGYSQDFFALHAKIDRSYMGRIERAEANVTLDFIEIIAKALNCQPFELLK